MIFLLFMPGLEFSFAQIRKLGANLLGEFNVVLAQAGAKADRLTDAELATCAGVMLGSIVLASLIQPLLLRKSSLRLAVERQLA